MSSSAEKALELFKATEGQEDGVSDWHLVDQAQINLFADATLDRQFIHVDPEMAKHGPFGTTIAHGFLTLSLIPFLSAGIPAKNPGVYDGAFTFINYGLDKVRFPSPVKVGSRVRARKVLVSAELAAPNALLIKNKVSIEIDGEPKPGCVAETLTRIVYA
ncbi:MAG: MaoC family dehydratase [Deltaproteobacteria bacterium]|nr:MaoC family dehydratase [Deltaproteobacteria bacterium]